jgi:hypothetical protein
MACRPANINNALTCTGNWGGYLDDPPRGAAVHSA